MSVRTGRLENLFIEQRPPTPTGELHHRVLRETASPDTTTTTRLQREGTESLATNARSTDGGHPGRGRILRRDSFFSFSFSFTLFFFLFLFLLLSWPFGCPGGRWARALPPSPRVLHVPGRQTGLQVKKCAAIVYIRRLNASMIKQKKKKRGSPRTGRLRLDTLQSENFFYCIRASLVMTNYKVRFPALL